MGEKMTPALDDKLRCLQSLLQQMGASVACKTVGEARDALLTAHLTKPAQAVDVARRFHEEYERLAPSFGYETRPETRVFDPESPNGRLMIAVCERLAAALPKDSNPQEDTPDAAR